MALHEVATSLQLPDQAIGELPDSPTVSLSQLFRAFCDDDDELLSPSLLPSSSGSVQPVASGLDAMGRVAAAGAAPGDPSLQVTPCPAETTSRPHAPVVESLQRFVVPQPAVPAPAAPAAPAEVCAGGISLHPLSHPPVLPLPFQQPASCTCACVCGGGAALTQLRLPTLLPHAMFGGLQLPLAAPVAAPVSATPAAGLPTRENSPRTTVWQPAGSQQVYSSATQVASPSVLALQPAVVAPTYSNTGKPPAARDSTPSTSSSTTTTAIGGCQTMAQLGVAAAAAAAAGAQNISNTSSPVAAGVFAVGGGCSPASSASPPSGNPRPRWGDRRKRKEPEAAAASCAAGSTAAAQPPNKLTTGGMLLRTMVQDLMRFKQQVYTNSEQQMRLLITTGSLQGQQPQSLTTTAAAGDRDGAPGPMPYQQQLAAPPAL